MGLGYWVRVIGFVPNKREVEREREDPLEREKRRKGWRQPAQPCQRRPAGGDSAAPATITRFKSQSNFLDLNPIAY